jgi:uncharacterized membrane protein
MTSGGAGRSQLPNGDYGSAPQGPHPHQQMAQPPLPPHQTQPLPPVPQQFGAPVSRRSPLLGIGVIVAILLGATALVVSLTGVGRQSVQSTTATSASATPAAGGDTTEADRALCQAIAPVMTDADKAANDWTAQGEQGTPSSDAALPKFVSDSRDHAKRLQESLDSHSEVQPFFRRTLQRYIDDLSLYVANVRPGAKQPYDATMWSESLGAYGGPLSICQGLGINW